MLRSLSIKNFTIVTQSTVEFKNGLTVITGETGAGKSIAIDAINFALGGKFDASFQKDKEVESAVSVLFTPPFSNAAVDMLKEWSIDSDEINISRTIAINGRSQVRINGNIVSVQQVKALAPLLIEIHGQHAHQKILRSDEQRRIIDSCLEKKATLNEYFESYRAWNTCCLNIEQLSTERSQRENTQALLEYQKQELSELSPIEGEYEELQLSFNLLSQAEFLLQQHSVFQSLMIDSEELAIIPALEKALKVLSTLTEAQPDLNDKVEKMFNIKEELKDIQRDALRKADSVDIDPEALYKTTERLQHYQRLSKKHKTEPGELFNLLDSVEKTLKSFTISSEKLEQELISLPKKEQKLKESGNKLNEERVNASRKISEFVQSLLPSLNLPYGQFTISIKPLENHFEHGVDDIDFLFSANTGQALSKLSSVASGGELSRLSLLLQLASFNSEGDMTLIFDEVDVGISGGTASAVGKLLKELGKKAQAICISHLPQVSAFADQHLLVIKSHTQKETSSKMITLDFNERVEELARLLGGAMVTDSARINAKDMLECSGIDFKLA